MDRLATRELIPISWVERQAGTASASRFFYSSYSDALDSKRPSMFPTGTLLELLASHPHRVEEAESMILGGMNTFGKNLKIAWVAVGAKTRSTIGYNVPLPFDGLTALGVLPMTLVENQENGNAERWLVLGLSEAYEELQRYYQGMMIHALFDPDIRIGFGNAREFHPEVAIRELFSKRQPEVLGALEVYRACLEEVLNTQSVLAKDFRRHFTKGRMDDYSCWLREHEQVNRMSLYTGDRKDFTKRFCETLGLGADIGWVTSELGAHDNGELTTINFKPKPGRSVLEAVDEFIRRIRPKLDGAFWYGLDLGNTGLNAENLDQIVAKLVKSGALYSINVLSLAGLDSLSDQAILPLLRETGTEALRDLDLSETDISDHGIIALFRSRNLRNLHRLDISHVHFTPEGAEAVMKTEGLPSLAKIIYSPHDWDNSLITRFKDWLKRRSIANNDIGSL